MLSYSKDIIAKAEAACTGDVASSLAHLRSMGLDEFIRFLFSLPRDQYPRLSACLPRMASEEVQKNWTGSSGARLLQQTSAFVWVCQAFFQKATGQDLYGKTILDFGCGYGRFIRAMYYFTDPSKIFGVDPWEGSLSKAKECGILGNLIKSDAGSDHLPVPDGSVDFAYAFSVFTHLPPETFALALSGLRKVIKPTGAVLITIRPIEYWTMKPDIKSAMEQKHTLTGWAFHPHSGELGRTYGDTSVAMDVIHKLPGWKVIDTNTSPFDQVQTAICLKPY